MDVIEQDDPIGQPLFLARFHRVEATYKVVDYMDSLGQSSSFAGDCLKPSLTAHPQLR